MRNSSTLRRTAAGAVIALTAGLAGAMLVATPAQALTLTVTTDADAFPVAPVGSLREAIEAANLSAGLDEIVFDPSVQDITLVADLPTIIQDLTIEGSAVVDAEVGIVSPSTTFTVGAGVSFALQNADIDTSNALSGTGVTSTGGNVYLSNVRTFGYPDEGVSVTEGDLSITLSDLSNNGGAGAYFSNTGAHFFYSTVSDYNNNGTGLHINTTSGTSVTVQDVEASRNIFTGIEINAANLVTPVSLSFLTLEENGAGLEIETFNSSVSLSEVTAEDNEGFGISIDDEGSLVTGDAIRSNRNGLISEPAEGGGIHFIIDGSTVTLTNVQTNGNHADGGAGIGVQHMLDVSSFSLTGAEVRDNVASSLFGGGISFGQINSSGGTAKQLTFDDVEVTGNTAAIGGGGLYIDNLGGGVPFAGGIDITESTFAGNTTTDGNGGGIHVGAFTHSTDGFPIIEIDSSTISGNSAPEGSGGGLFLDKGQDTLEEAGISIVNSTVSGNTAFFGGAAWIGGNAANDDQVRISSDSNTIVNNTASNVGGFLFEDSTTEFAVYNTILANNSGLVDLFYQDTPDPGVLTVNYSNVGSVLPDLAPFIAAGAGNQVGVDPLLGPLADNGGPTLTHLPQPGSPVFDAGDPAFAPPPAVDQRGEPRVMTRIDMGSVESPKTFKLAATGAEFSPVLPIGALVLLLGGAALVLWRVRARA